jgi:lysophospholipid acyltransferase (LPLAT)-like uncharacterized protein
MAAPFYTFKDVLKNMKGAMEKLNGFLLLNVGVPVIVFLVRLFGMTWRFRELTQTGAEPRRGKTETFIYGFMHCQQIAMIYSYRNMGLSSISSQHKDGEIAARAAGAFGIHMARGSSTRGGANALLGLKTFMEQGYAAAITTDGPRGPVGTVNKGVIYLAKLTGKKIVPVAFACDRKIKLRSWDKFEIPLPFAKGGFYFGEPVAVAPDISDEGIETLKQELTVRLREVNEKCEKAVNGGNGS